MKKTTLMLIKLYKFYISPFLSASIGGGCRFTPTCSVYSYHSIKKFGLLKGGLLSLKRILKCNPFSKIYFDPIPTHS